LLSGEACDDGNLTDGDGCSSTCTLEAGFTCAPQLRDCEQINGQCVLRVPAVFRDFADTRISATRPATRAPGALATALDAGGRPVLGAAAAAVMSVPEQPGKLRRLVHEQRPQRHARRRVAPLR
jgi:cysteine-rich repeat protein